MGEGVSSHPDSQEYDSLEDYYNDICPYFMAIGMSYDDFWYKSPHIAKMFLKAHKIKQKQRNEEMWLQGYYVYIAVASVSPVLHAFAKKGTKPLPYLKEPLAITKEEFDKQQEKARLARKNAFIARLMKSATRKGGSNNG